jgi:photosystem II stability/assembly factor-like uncharacterized protein
MGLTLLFVCINHVWAEDRLTASAVMSQHAQRSLLLDVAVSEAAIIAVGEQGTVLKKTLNAPWQQQAIPTSELITAVQFISPTQVMAVGHGGVVLKSQDSGEHWARVLDGNAINQLHQESYQNFIDQGGDPRLPELPLEELEYLLDDAQVAHEEGPTQPILNLFFIDHQTGFLLGAYGTLLKTTDAGQSWSVLSHRVPNPDKFHLTAMTFWQQSLWMVGEAGLIFRSDDEGEHWSAEESPYEGSWFDIAVVGNDLWVAGLRGHLFYKAPNAQWQRVEAGEQTLSQINTCGAYAEEGVISGFGGTVLHIKNKTVSSVDAQGRQAFSAAACWKDEWYLVGEKGVQSLRISGMTKELP